MLVYLGAITMKKTMLFSGLVILHSATFAAASTSTASESSQAVTQTAPSAKTVEQHLQVPTQSPAAATPTPPASSAAKTTLTLADSVDCHYHIPANTSVTKDVVLLWAQKAIVQAFDYDSTNLDQKLHELKNCFTDQGWQSFNDALSKSGNISAVKAQKLTVSSQIEGKSEAYPEKSNQWTVNLPLQVVYQNDKEKLTQLLSIKLLVARKVNGDLGIAQVVASPADNGQQAPVESEKK